MTPTVLITLAFVHSAPWIMDTARLAGEWRGEGPFGRGVLVFTPSGACMEKSPGRLRVATYWLDPSKRPAEIDFWDPAEEAPRRGIYKFSGVNLTVCWAENAGGARPAGFGVAGAGTGTDILHLSRVARVTSPVGNKESGLRGPWANKLFTGSTNAPPPVFVQDAGVLAKGETTMVLVKMTNIYAVQLKVLKPTPISPRVQSAVIRWPDRLDPKQAGFIEVAIDTRGLDGESAVRIPVYVQGIDSKTGDLVASAKTGMPFYSWAEVVIRFVSK